MKIFSLFSSLWFWVALMHVILLGAWYTIITIANK